MLTVICPPYSRLGKQVIALYQRLPFMLGFVIAKLERNKGWEKMPRELRPWKGKEA